MKILIELKDEKVVSVKVVEKTKKKRNIGETADFLRNLLSPGPLFSTEIFLEAERKGIGRDRIYYASRELGIIKKPVGYRACDGWLWELKKDEQTNMAHDDEGNESDLEPKAQVVLEPPSRDR
jgi:hypothetical protein